MNDITKRTLRTFLQAFIGTFAALAIPAMNAAITSAGDATGYVSIDVTLLGNAAIAGLIAGVIAIITAVQNILEDASGKSVLPK